MSEGILRSFVRDILASKYDAQEHDPEIPRLDGNGRYYPNCASDVWLRSCENEIIEPIEGHISGHIPKWLNGSLLRNGPGNWKVGDMSFKHLFDCSALLHRFAIKDGRVTYQNRFVKTETYKKNMIAKRIVVTEFGTASVPDPCHSIFDRVSNIFRPENGSDNTMISIYPFGDEFYTFTESPFIHRINPRTLETERRINVSDFAGLINHSSHPHIMPNGTVFNLGTTMKRTGPAYNVICFPNGDSMFEDAYIVASIPCRWKLHPGYMHTFGITENFFVIVEQPLSVSLPKYIKAHFHNQHLAACLEWYENKPTLFHLIDRKSGKLTHTFQSDPFFYLHIINQYEDNDGHVVIDICCYKDAEMINCMYMESIINMQTNPDYAALFRGRPLRFVLPLGSSTTIVGGSERIGGKRKLVKSLSLASISARLQRPKLTHSESQYDDISFMATNSKNETNRTDNCYYGNINKNDDKDQRVNLVTLPNTKAEAFQTTDRTIQVKPELLCDLGCETPRINYEKYMGKKYRYFYAISSDVDAENPGTLIKVDVVNKTCKTWCETNCYPSEPIFVQSPNSQEEDDGVILASMVWAGLDDHHVGLLVLCAKTFVELGRCEFHTNGPVPKCLHGWFAQDVV